MSLRDRILKLQHSRRDGRGGLPYVVDFPEVELKVIHGVERLPGESLSGWEVRIKRQTGRNVKIATIDDFV